jgi:hypothetical protein
VGYIIGVAGKAVSRFTIVLDLDMFPQQSFQERPDRREPQYFEDVRVPTVLIERVATT